eukprot:5090135-Amphidinium_carterae.1
MEGPPQSGLQDIPAARGVRTDRFPEHDALQASWDALGPTQWKGNTPKITCFQTVSKDLSDEVIKPQNFEKGPTLQN